MMDIILLRKVGDWLLGTCNTATAAIEYFDLQVDENDLEDELLNINIETCKGCYWWFESGELVPGDDEADDFIGFCSDCRT